MDEDVDLSDSFISAPDLTASECKETASDCKETVNVELQPDERALNHPVDHEDLI